MIITRTKAGLRVRIDRSNPDHRKLLAAVLRAYRRVCSKRHSRIQVRRLLLAIWVAIEASDEELAIFKLTI